MKKELPYFKIENSYGGNQDWFRDPMMKLGGCAAATACDVSIYMALYQDKTHLYPFDISNLNKGDYISFSAKMKPYLSPRWSGINTLDIYIEGVKQYLMDSGEASLQLSGFSGDRPLEEAAAQIRKQIGNKMPIPYLLLKHKSPNIKFFVWHWFLLVGYEEYDDGFFVKAATYGSYHWLSLRELWDTGYSEKGGMILLGE
ncbi:MAG TPA: hypothetical protein GXX75_13935 [Clostridiales bacterium]|nr:hypothetical protein [Clostridiales bacterium]